MFCPRSVMALLAVLALSAKVAESDIAAPSECLEPDFGKGFCLNCKTKAKCGVTVGAPPDPKGECTVPGEACTVLAGVATCRPFAETACDCNTEAQCDAYDPDSVLICLDDGETYSIDCSSDGETCVSGACAPPTTTETTVSPDDICVGAPEGVVVITPMCTIGAYCSLEEPLVPFNCPSGTYLDVAEVGCKPIPPVPCAGCDSGACPDKIDCSKWYICDGSVVLDEETCDAATPVFDIDSKECVVAESGTCTGNAGCTFGLTTIAETTGTSSDGGSTTSGTGSTGDSTTSGAGSTGDSTTSGSGSTGDSTTSGSGSTGDSTTSGAGSTGDSTTSGAGSTGDATTTTSRPATCTAANVGQRYPYEGNCKMYWACMQLANGYGYVAATCMGEYVFNPATGYCDYPANVPDCVPPA